MYIYIIYTFQEGVRGLNGLHKVLHAGSQTPSLWFQIGTLDHSTVWRQWNGTDPRTKHIHHTLPPPNDGYQKIVKKHVKFWRDLEKKKKKVSATAECKSKGVYDVRTILVGCSSHGNRLLPLACEGDTHQKEGVAQPWNVIRWHQGVQRFPGNHPLRHVMLGEERRDVEALL